MKRPILVLVLFSCFLVLVTGLSVTNAQDTGIYWTVETVDDSADVGQVSALAIDSNGVEHIVYTDATNQTVKYAHRGSDGWQIQTLPEFADDNEVHGLELDTSGRPHILLRKGEWEWGAVHQLTYAYWDGSIWRAEVVSSNVLLGAGAFDIDADGQPHICYATATEHLGIYTFYNGDEWQSETLPFYCDDLRIDSSQMPRIWIGTGYAYPSTTGWQLVDAPFGGFHFKLDSQDRAHVLHTSADPLDEFLGYGRETVTGWDIDIIGAAPLPYQDGFAGFGQSTFALDDNDTTHLVICWREGLGYNVLQEGAWSSGLIEAARVSSCWTKPAIATDGANIPHISYHSGTDYALKLATAVYGTNAVTNPRFESGTAGWHFYTNGAGVFTVPDEYANVSLTREGSNAQLYQYNIALEPYERYLLRFSAKSNHGEDLQVYLHKHTSPYTNYGFEHWYYYADLTPDWQTFEVEFTTRGFSQPVNDARLRFWFAPYDQAGTVYNIDNVVLMKLEPGTPPPEPPPDPEDPVPDRDRCDPVAGSVTRNPGFEWGTAAWLFYSNASATFQSDTWPNSFSCERGGRIDIATSGNNVQLFQINLGLQPRTKYVLRMAGKSSGGQDVQPFLHKHTSPYTNYGLNGPVLDLTPEWKYLEVEFTTANFSAPVSDARLSLWLAPYDTPGATFWFDDIVLLPASSATQALTLERLTDTVTTPPAAGPTDTHLISGYFIDDDDAGRLSGAAVPTMPVNHAPDCSAATASLGQLWPVNNKFVPVEVLGVTDPDGDPVTITIASIYQDELVGKEADGRIDGPAAYLRAERDGKGDGRVYHVDYMAEDGNGGLCTGTVRVEVPHDQGKGVVDGGPIFDSTDPSQ